MFSKNLSQLAILTVHFGDELYVRGLIRNLNEVGLMPNSKLFIIDNSNSLSIDYENCEVLKFENSFTASKQHGYSLNKGLARIRFDNFQHILVLDSDVVLQSRDWLNWIVEVSQKFDAVLAIQEGSKYLTHPCFMYLKLSAGGNLDFLEGLDEFGVDTGRLIGYKLSINYKVMKLYPRKSRNMAVGYFYLNDSIFHLTSASLPYLNSRLNNGFRRVVGILLRQEIYLKILNQKKLRRFGIFLIYLKVFLIFPIKYRDFRH